ncbi:hypothetical protein M9H77_27856 [Catharanthus roseus]|uniref:Uncharacterized protein n=1 Tax=Catharanthus roseus TaxID=4058 RepID=A0ACC0AI02_CATRO|nr:hypothetical protein M9H77_27856 [Catharanthus roseus]
MIKVLTMVVLLLVAFLTLAGAEENQGLQECMQQTQRHMPELQHCPQFLSGMFSVQGLQHFVECCLGLRSIEEPSCRCWAVEEAVTQQQPEEGGQGTMMQRARYLPQMCGLIGSPC